MIFEIKTKEIILPNGESDGYETIEYDVSNDIVIEWILDIIEKYYGKGARDFAEDYNVLGDSYCFYNIADYLADYLDEKAQYYYDNEVE